MRKLRPTWELNQPDLMPLGTGCMGQVKFSQPQREKPQQICHSSQWLPPQAEAGAARDGDRWEGREGYRFQKGRLGTEGQQVLVSTLLPALTATGPPGHSLHRSSLMCTGRSLDWQETE